MDLRWFSISSEVSFPELWKKPFFDSGFAPVERTLPVWRSDSFTPRFGRCVYSTSERYFRKSQKNAEIHEYFSCVKCQIVGGRIEDRVHMVLNGEKIRRPPLSGVIVYWRDVETQERLE